jgi:cytochrome c oxidase subunit 4
VGADFGPVNVLIALTIATIKASLVALFFMHPRHDRPMDAVIFLSGLAFLALFLTLCIVDTDARDVVRPSKIVRTR